MSILKNTKVKNEKIQAVYFLRQLVLQLCFFCLLELQVRICIIFKLVFRFLVTLKPKTQVVTPFLLKILGWFIPVMREMPEMMYQYNQDYIFNSEKFESHFNFKPTPYLEGIKYIIQTDYKM